MIVCIQCSGKGAVQGQNALINLAGGYTEKFTGPGDTPPTTQCQQCLGKGYQTGGSY